MTFKFLSLCPTSLWEVWMTLNNSLTCYCFVTFVLLQQTVSMAMMGERNIIVKFKMENLVNSVKTVRYYDYVLNFIFMYLFYYYYFNFSLLSFQLGNIHLSWDLIINRNRLGGLIYNLESFLRLNMFEELRIFAFIYMYLDTS